MQLPLLFDSSDWDGFRTQPVRWAAAHGLPPPSPDWTPEPPRLARRTDAGALDLDNTLDTHRDCFSLPAPLTGAAGQALLDRALEWKKAAKALRAAVWRHRNRENRHLRASALRGHNLRLWCRLLRPAQRMQLPYAPGRVSLADGAVRIPTTPEEMRLGAFQEWKPLHQGPEEPWRHPALIFWRDALNNERASPDVLAIAEAEPGSDLRRLGLSTFNLALSASWTGRVSKFAS